MLYSNAVALKRQAARAARTAEMEEPIAVVENATKYVVNIEGMSKKSFPAMRLTTVGDGVSMFRESGRNM